MQWEAFSYNRTTVIAFLKRRQFSKVCEKTLEVQLLSFGKFLDFGQMHIPARQHFPHVSNCTMQRFRQV